MEDVVVLGGGPGGLYTAILLKRDWPSTRVRVLERNRADDTYGFGVAFHTTTLRNLAEADPPSRRAIDEILMPWEDVCFRAKGLEQRVGGHGFAGCSRRRLLQVLQQRARELGVELQFDRSGHPNQFPEADLIVAADGANSLTRQEFSAHFQARVDSRPTRFVWLGTTKALDAMTFTFAETSFGVFVAHAYPHTQTEGTWIVETDPETFSRAGLDVDDERATAALLQSAFAPFLHGRPLLTNKSHWRQFPLITCRTWIKDNLVLLGDAKGTVHYSIGSGTKLAMEDAVALRQALRGTDDVREGLERFERVRRSELESLQEMGLGSMLWFEQVPLHWAMPPHQFIFGGITRKGNESYDTILVKAPQLVRGATRELAATADDVPAAPLHLGYRLGDIELPNRLINEAADLGSTEPQAGLTYRVTSSGGGAPSFLVVDHSTLLEPDGSLQQLADRITQAGMCGLLIDITKWDWDAAPPASSLPAGTWPESAGCLGLMLTAPPVPHAVVPLVTAWTEIGVRYVHVAGPFRRAILVADLIRHELGLWTAVSVESAEEANTALAAGRVDLVSLLQAPDGV